AKGAVFAKHFPIFWGSSGADPKTFPLAAPVGTLYGTQRYDAFGRQVETTDLDGTTTLYTKYTALGSHMYDAADLENGDHFNTYASERKDGHGRSVSTIERFDAETRETITKYLPTGEPQKITRKRGSTSDEVVRWIRYDSLGRMVLNVEPNTTVNFTDDEEADPTPSSGIKAWRYAY